MRSRAIVLISALYLASLGVAAFGTTSGAPAQDPTPGSPSMGAPSAPWLSDGSRPASRESEPRAGQDITFRGFMRATIAADPVAAMDHVPDGYTLAQPARLVVLEVARGIDIIAVAVRASTVQDSDLDDADDLAVVEVVADLPGNVAMFRAWGFPTSEGHRSIPSPPLCLGNHVDPVGPETACFKAASENVSYYIAGEAMPAPLLPANKVLVREDGARLQMVVSGWERMIGPGALGDASGSVATLAASQAAVVETGFHGDGWVEFGPLTEPS